MRNVELHGRSWHVFFGTVSSRQNQGWAGAQGRASRWELARRVVRYRLPGGEPGARFVRKPTGHVLQSVRAQAHGSCGACTGP